jgi:hypothetical protein
VCPGTPEANQQTNEPCLPPYRDALLAPGAASHADQHQIQRLPFIQLTHQNQDSRRPASLTRYSLPLNPVAGTPNNTHVAYGLFANRQAGRSLHQRYFWCAVWALGRIDTHGAAPLLREHQAVNPATGYTLPLNPVAGRQSNTHVASLRFTAAHWR